MDVAVLIGLMGVLTVTTLYFWLLRKRGQESEAR
jgi:hypothetical protein